MSSENRGYSRYEPKTDSYKNILLVVVPDSHIQYKYMSSTLRGLQQKTAEPYGYVNEIGGDSMVISENHFNAHVISHEIGHLLTLVHIGDMNHRLMGTYSYYLYKDKIKYILLDREVEKMKKNITSRSKLLANFLENKQQIMINKIVTYIKENNYFGDKYHSYRDEQIKATKWWTDTFYTSKYEKNLVKEVDNIINYNLQESKQFNKQLVKNLV